MTLPKSIVLPLSTDNSAFLHVQMRGMFICPVSDNIGKYDSISWFNYGVNVMVIVVDRPADILPVGVYYI
jgi:hypothetical protein